MDSKKTLTADQGTKPSRRKFFIGAGATVGAAAVVSQTPLGQALVQDALSQESHNELNPQIKLNIEPSSIPINW